MIRLIDDYVVTVDPYCYTLARDTGKTDKKGNRKLKNISYHSTLEKAIAACKEDRRKRCLPEGDTSLYEALTAMRQSDREISELLKEVMG